eukprot:182065-Pyramimonas_sp.AAC.1
MMDQSDAGSRRKGEEARIHLTSRHKLASSSEQTISSRLAMSSEGSWVCGLRVSDRCPPAVNPLRGISDKNLRGWTLTEMLRISECSRVPHRGEGLEPGAPLTRSCARTSSHWVKCLRADSEQGSTPPGLEVCEVRNQTPISFAPRA